MIGCRHEQLRRCSGDAVDAATIALTTMSIGACAHDGLAHEQSHWPALQGPHNAENAAAAIAVCAGARALPTTRSSEGLRTYPGLPHRMERVREKDGVLFVNDSKATNPTATAPALAAFPASAGSSAGRRRPTISTNARRISATSARPTRSARPAELFARLLAPHMPVTNCGKLENAVSEAARGCRRRVIRCCCRRPARRSTSSATSSSAATGSATWWGRYDRQHLRHRSRPRRRWSIPSRYGRSDTSAAGRWFWEIDKVLLLLVGGADRHRPDRGRRGLARRRRSAIRAARCTFSELYYFYRQIAWIAVGVPVMIVISMMTPRARQAPVARSARPSSSSCWSSSRCSAPR